MKGEITKDFRWEEVLGSEMARVNGIDNVPGAEESRALVHLVKVLLQPLRERYGKPIRITSGYRCERLNKLVGGVASSQHLKGEAADCKVEDAGVLLKVLIASGLVFDQAILYKRKNFLHLSLKRGGNNRKMVIMKR